MELRKGMQEGRYYRVGVFKVLAYIIGQWDEFAQAGKGLNC